MQISNEKDKPTTSMKSKKNLSTFFCKKQRTIIVGIFQIVPFLFKKLKQFFFSVY